MAHKRKDTLVKTPGWEKHLRPAAKRRVAKAERRAGKKEANKEFEVLVFWNMSARVKVQAPDIETACDKAENLPLPKHGSYVEGSFEVDRDLAYGEQTLAEVGKTAQKKPAKSA